MYSIVTGLGIDLWLRVNDSTTCQLRLDLFMYVRPVFPSLVYLMYSRVAQWLSGLFGLLVDGPITVYHIAQGETLFVGSVAAPIHNVKSYR